MKSSIKLLTSVAALFALAACGPVTSRSSSSPGASSPSSSSRPSSSSSSSSSSRPTSTRSVVHVTSVELNKEAATLEEGKTLQLRAYLSPYDADDKSVSWSSGDTDVATVSSDGLVTAKKTGQATITVTTTDGGLTATCLVTVVEKERYSYQIGETVCDIVEEKSSYSTSYKIRLITPVTNDGNVNIYLGGCSYDIYSSTGSPIMDISVYYVEETPWILMPGETGYFTAVKSYEGEEKENLSVVAHPDIKNAKSHKAVRYDVSDITFGIDDFWGTMEITGKVTNNTTEKASTLDRIDILLFGHDGKFLSTYSDYLPVALAPGESCIFEADNMINGNLKIAAEDVGSYLVYAFAYDLVI